MVVQFAPLVGKGNGGLAYRDVVRHDSFIGTAVLFGRSLSATAGSSKSPYLSDFFISTSERLHPPSCTSGPLSIFCFDASATSGGRQAFGLSRASTVLTGTGATQGAGTSGSGAPVEGGGCGA